MIDEPDIQYIVGSAVAIEAAISELRAAGKTEIGLISSYLSHGTYRGVTTYGWGVCCTSLTDKWLNKVDYPLNRPSVTYAINHSEMQCTHYRSTDSATLKDQIIADSLSPSEFRPVIQCESLVLYVET
ncbi:hypothetical protein O9993_03120 [Vibrio lentus]|nr:hypothetical protein [Vibrio lentus]